MLLVIFGAGASYDSCPHVPPSIQHKDRPPLAKDLFDTRELFQHELSEFDECLPLIPRLREADISVEERLEIFQAQADSGTKKRHSQLAAIRFYLRAALWRLTDEWNKVCRGVTNYKTLLDDLESWQRKTGEQICFVTFNYDKMLEESLRPAMGVGTSSLEDYIKSDLIKVIKLHGSVDWARVAMGNVGDTTIRQDPTRIMHRVIAGADSLTFGGIQTINSRTDYVITHPSHGEEYPRMVLSPAVAIPVMEKDEKHFECPEAHITALNNCLPKTKKVLSIGWRGAEKHFLAKMNRYCERRDRLEIMIVAGSAEDANETEWRFKGSGISGSFTLSSLGFTQTLVKNKIDDFLDKPFDPGGDYRAL